MMNDSGMNSFNHYAYGAVADWIYRYAGGVDATPLDAGFHTVILHPVFDARLGNISLDYASAYGPIHSDWTVKGATAEWHVTLPANTTGWLELGKGEAGKYKLDGAALTQAKATTKSRQNGFELASGSYTFVVELQ
jgi:alpha-L-rhamnosidase